MKFSLARNGGSKGISASPPASVGAVRTGGAASRTLLEASLAQSSPKEPFDLGNSAATISRRGFLVGSTAALVVAALGSTRAAEESAPKLRIGFILPENGPLAGEAASLFSGFQLFMKEHGADAARFEVLKRDTGPDDKKTLEALAELVMNREVHVLVAPPTLSGSEKAIHAVAGGNIILIVTNPAVRFVGGELCLPGSFRVCENNYQAAHPLAAWALRNVGKKIFVTGQDDAQGNEQADYFAYGFDKAGGSFGDRLMLSASSGNFQAVIEAIRKTEPDLVFAAFRGPAAPNFLKAVRGPSASSGIPIIGPESLTEFPGTVSLAGDACKGVSTLTSLARPAELVEEVKKSTGGNISSAARAAQGYDIGTIALHLAGQVDEWNTDFPKIISSLQSFDFEGPRGRIKFDLNHEIVVDAMVQRWSFGNLGPSSEVLAKLGPSRTPDFGCGRIGFPKKPESDRPEEEPTWEEKEE